MGEENSITRPNPENSEKTKNGESTRDTLARTKGDAETTLDGTANRGTAGETTILSGRTSIGPYFLTRLLGEGGMGQVWLAEQIAPVKRRVALKLIKGGMYDNRVMQRFEAERQSLAVMNHPTIAKIFDAGSTDDGQPYFVMEYVEGLSITHYCDHKRMKIRERLELFIKVCEGVQHAHQKAIIHRDLKPSNILVQEVDGKPLPRIIDFGIAKAISQEGTRKQAKVTRVGALMGTPGFISPEQADPGVLDVDTRTDVYSLGVILYVLLTGKLPFDEERWTSRPLDEVLRELRQEDPLSPSAKLKVEKKTATESAENRSSDARQLVNQLRGDLDWITMKALEKDRARRYGTPTELAGDVQRYLAKQPVMARGASAGYHLQKYVQRHRMGVAVGTGAAAMLLAFAAAQAVELRRITRERDRANRITEFMSNMFKVADPNESRGNSITAREILDKGAASIDQGLAQDPEVGTQLMDLMGTVYQTLGLYSRSQTLLEHAVELQKRALGPDRAETLKSQSDLAWTLDHTGKFTEAENLERQTLEAQRRVLGPENKQTLKTMNNLAWTLHQEGRDAEAEKIGREGMATEQHVYGENNSLTVAAMSNLGVILKTEGKYSEAEKLERESLEVRKRVFGMDQPETLQTMDNLATILTSEERYAEAEELVRETLELERRVLGPEHPFTAETIDNLAYDVMKQGRAAEAEKLQREALEIEKRTLGPEHPDTLLTMSNVAASLEMEGRYADSQKVLEELREMQKRVYGQNSPKIAETTYDLACLAARSGKKAAALALLQEAIDRGLSAEVIRQMDKDDDLNSLHGDPAFEAMVAARKKE